jgi:hypothetical protein
VAQLPRIGRLRFIRPAEIRQGDSFEIPVPPQVVARQQETQAREFVGYGAMFAVSAALIAPLAPPPASASTTFGTHEAIVRQADNRSSVWGQGVGDLAPRPIFRTFTTREQDRGDTIGYALVFKQPPPTAVSFIPELIVERINASPQTDPSQLPGQIYKQAPPTAMPTPNRPAFFAGQQPEPNRLQALINRQPPPTTIAAAPITRMLIWARLDYIPLTDVFDPDVFDPDVFDTGTPLAFIASPQEDPTILDPARITPRPPPNTPAQNPPNRPKFFHSAQQDPTQIQPRLKGQTPATAEKPKSAASYRFGTDAETVLDRYPRGSMWHGIIPSIAATVPNRPASFVGQQAEPDRLQPVITRSRILASAAVQSPPPHPTLFAGQQLEPDRLQATVSHIPLPPTIIAQRIFAVGQQFPDIPPTAFVAPFGPPEALGLAPTIFAGQQAEPERQQALFVGQQPPSATVQSAPNRPTFFAGQQLEPDRQQGGITRQAPPPTAPTPPPLTSAKLAGQQGEPDRLQAQIFKQAPKPLTVVRWILFAGQQGEPDRLQATIVRQPPQSIAPSAPPLMPTFFVGQQVDDGRQIPSRVFGQQPPGVPFEGTTTIIEVDVRFAQMYGVVAISFGEFVDYDVSFTNLLSRDVEF